MTSTTLTPAEAARFMGAYAKTYHAGAFAMPTAGDLESNPGMLRVWRTDGGRTMAAVKTLTRAARRTDFRGTEYFLPAGATVATHIARDPNAAVPMLEGVDFVFAYTEDTALVATLAGRGWVPVATKVSAAAELITCYARPAYAGLTLPVLAHDQATVTDIPGLSLTAAQLEVMRAEVAAAAGRYGWADDFPLYSDGSWGALSLRGYFPDDPTRGLKPAEMPKTWKQANPDDLQRSCEWTVLTETCPVITGFVRDVKWWGGTQRVRLLQMAGRDGAGGQLGRHTDVTDREGGLADGQVARFHIPLVTHPDVRLYAWDLDGSRIERHLAAGRCYYLDARKPHAVVNAAGIDRIHLVVDVIADAEVRARIGAAHEASRG